MNGDHNRKQMDAHREQEDQKWKTQRGARTASLRQTCPEMEENSSAASLIPFAKQSKMVSRHTLGEDPDSPSVDYSNRNFWDRLVQQQSCRWMEEYHEAPSLLMSGCVAQSPAVIGGGPFPWQVISTVQKLPSPKELCRRKKKRARQQRLEKGGVLSVCYHLEELKRRQSSIDELKKTKWGGCLPQPFHEADNTAVVSHPRAPWSPFSVPRSAAKLYEKEDPVFHRHSASQILCAEWNSSMREQQRIPQGSPGISYTMATLGRYPTMEACRPEEDFGEFQLQSEE